MIQQIHNNNYNKKTSSETSWSNWRYIEERAAHLTDWPSDQPTNQLNEMICWKSNDIKLN